MDTELIMRHSPETLTREIAEGILNQGVTAFVVETYSLAYHLWNMLHALSLEVPKDVSIAVLGGPMDPEAVHIDWTSFEIPCEDMGKQAVRTLVNILEGSTTTPIHLTLQCTMKLGTTMGAASRMSES